MSALVEAEAARLRAGGMQWKAIGRQLGIRNISALRQRLIRTGAVKRLATAGEVMVSNVRLPERRLAALHAEARQRGLTLSALVREILVAHLDRVAT